MELKRVLREGSARIARATALTAAAEQIANNKCGGERSCGERAKNSGGARWELTPLE